MQPDDPTTGPRDAGGDQSGQQGGTEADGGQPAPGRPRSCSAVLPFCYRWHFFYRRGAGDDAGALAAVGGDRRKAKALLVIMFTTTKTPDAAE